MKDAKIMIDANGQSVPTKYVSSFDKARQKTAERILARFDKARSVLLKVVTESVQDLDELMKLKEKLGEKGNFQMTSFDGLIEVQIRQQYNIMLDERVARARELMLECVIGILDKVNGTDVTLIRQLIEQAFRANRQGILPTTKIFSLMRMEVKDSRWNKAREILQDAIKPVRGKRYLVCSVRKTTQQDFKPISLNLNDCWPEAN